jgi:predicted PurR-regulated permease PerM
LCSIFTVFMLVKRLDLTHRFFRLVGLGQINIMTQALDDAAQRVSRYLLMQILVNAGFGLLFGFGLYWIGVPYPALWGVVGGLLRIVPYVGTMRLPPRCPSHSRWWLLTVGCRRCWCSCCLVRSS